MKKILLLALLSLASCKKEKEQTKEVCFVYFVEANGSNPISYIMIDNRPILVGGNTRYFFDTFCTNKKELGYSILARGSNIFVMFEDGTKVNGYEELTFKKIVQ